MKKLTLVLLALAAMLLTASVASAETSDIPEAAQKAAQSGLQEIQTLASAHPEEYDFSSKEEAQKLTLGEAYSLNGINADKLKDSKNIKISQIDERVNKWDFIVYADSQPKLILTISLTPKGEYTMSEFGGNPVNFKKTWDDFERFIQDKGGSSSPSIVVLNNKKTLFAEVNGEEWSTDIAPSVVQYETIKPDHSEATVQQWRKQVAAFQLLQSGGDLQYGNMEPAVAGNKERTGKFSSPLYVSLISASVILVAAIWLVRRKKSLSA